MDKEAIGYKFDTSINKPVLMKRCDNYYYAYPSITGWVFYRSRYLGERDKEIIDIDFDAWSHKVVDVLINESKILRQENTNLKQALNKIRKIINDKKEPFNWEYPDTNFWLNHNNIKDILQITDEVLGDDE